MIKVECVACKSSYDVDERRIPEKGMKMRCPKCSVSFMVGRDGVTSAIPASPPIAPVVPAAASSAIAEPTEPLSAADLPALSTNNKPASAFGAPPPSAFKKTLMGAGKSAAQPGGIVVPPLAPVVAAAPASEADADLPALKPAVKPAAKPVAPWGSLAPPSMETKPQPTAPRIAAPAGLPKGAMGTAGSGAAGIGTLKASAGSAFGAAPAGKHTLHGQAPRPAPIAATPTEQPLALDAQDFIDLPAPKLATAAARPLPQSPVVDLPGIKPPSAAANTGFAAASRGNALPAPSAPAQLDELPLIDLPSPKKPGPTKPANTIDLGELDLDLEGELDAGAELELDELASLPPSAADSLIDLPAAKPAKPAPAPEPPLVDLPSPKARAAPKPSFDAGAIDLPAPKAKAPNRPALSTDEIDLPGTQPFADLPAPKVIADLPAAKAPLVDLPAPRGLVDLPAPRGAVDLPGLKDNVDLPTPKGFADLPAPKGVTDLPGLRSDGDFGELDLPMPKAGEDEASFGDLELPELPVRPGFGNIELPVPRAGADMVPPKAATFHGVGPFGRRQDSANFGDLDLDGPEEAGFPELRDDDLVTLKNTGSATSTPPALQHHGSGDYGEASLLGDENDEPMEFGIAEPEEGEESIGLPPELLRRNKGDAQQAEDTARGKRALHLLIGVAGVLVLLGGGGAALGLTDYGFFGVYFWERFLPEAGDARSARDAIERAEKTAVSDTYRDVQRSLASLGESRRKTGLNRELLTRSLLHESLFAVRFGAHSASSAHAAAINARLEERHGLAPGMNLARAADALRRQALPDAERYLGLARSEAPQDPYVSLVAGELALQQNKLLDADKAFTEALRHGAGARAQWGLSRVALARSDVKAQRAAVEDTLKASPLHAEAHIAEARLLWGAEQAARAQTELRQALGQEPVAGQTIWGSKPAKAAGYSLLGFINEQRGHLSAAHKAYDDALAADPYLVEALLGAGRVYQRERRWNDALARFESALNLTQKSSGNALVLSGRRADVEAHLGQASAQLALNRAPEAKATLAGLLKDNPNDPEIVRAAGQAEDALSNKLSAEELLKKAVELAPTAFPGYLALAQHYFKNNRADKASETLNDAASKVEENVEMRRMLGQSELARHRIDSAVHEFKRAVELDPQDLDAQFGLGVAYRKSGQLPSASEIFERIALRDPQYAGLALERGQLLEASGQFERAVETYRAAHSKDPNDVQVSLRMGAALVEAGHLDEAEATLQSVMRELPNSADAEYFSGRLALARGRGPDALTHFDRALSLDGAQAVYHLYAGRAALDMANLGRALEEAEAALDRDPALGDGYWIRGIVRMRTGAVKDALKDARRALELNPGRFDAYALMAECFDELRQLNDAAAAYREALAKDPQRGEWWYKLGRLSLDMGARPAANEALEAAMRIGDKMEPRPYWLSDSYRLAGELARATNNRKQAVSMFLRYLAIAPDGAIDRDDVRKILTSWDVEIPQN